MAASTSTSGRPPVSKRGSAAALSVALRLCVLLLLFVLVVAPFDSAFDANIPSFYLVCVRSMQQLSLPGRRNMGGGGLISTGQPVAMTSQLLLAVQAASQVYNVAPS